MSDRSDYIRCVSGPLEEKLRATIATLAKANAELEARLEALSAPASAPNLDAGVVGDLVELKTFPAETTDVQSRYILAHQLRASADIQDGEITRTMGRKATTDRASLMRKAADAIEALAKHATQGTGGESLGTEWLVAAARIIYDDLEGPVADQDAGRQMRQWEQCLRIAKAIEGLAPHQTAISTDRSGT